MQGLTAKQAAVLAFVREAVETRGSAPTVREIAVAVGVSSTCSVQRRVEALVRKGYLTRPERYAYRGLALPGASCCPTCRRPYGVAP